MIYKEYDGIKLDNLCPNKIAKEVGTYGIVVIRNSNTKPKEFARWSYEFGYHLSPNVWATDKEFSSIFWRVSNQVIDKENKGLASDHELDWHTNITPVLDAEEVVGLYGLRFTTETETWFCNSIPYWNELDEESKKRYRQLTIILDPNRTRGRIQPGWSLNINKIYSKTVIRDLVKNRNTREIKDSTNMEVANKDKYQNSRCIHEYAKFVPKHPLKTEGLFFSPNEIHGFLENGEKAHDSCTIYWKTWNEMILSEKYTYKHKWREGDIILMDQILTVHRRPRISADNPRELLRIACWYKTKLRSHYGHVL